MMVHAQGPSRQHCSLLAVVCGKIHDNKQKHAVSKNQGQYPFPELASSGRLEVQVLSNPSIEEFGRAVELSQPNIVYLQGEQLEGNYECGSLVWGGVDLSTPEALCGIFGSILPTTVYIETPKGEKLAEALHSKGIPYVIYWENTFSLYGACHFRHAFLSVVQSSCSHTWDAFQLAHASFRLYCVQNNAVSSDIEKFSGKLGPLLLGDPPKFDIGSPEPDMQEEEGSPETLSAVKIYDDDVNIRFLVCGGPSIMDACVLQALEDGLNALLSVEIRGSKLHNRASAPPPPLQAGTFSRGVVTMRCDLSTSSSAHISLLVSGSAQACFNDQLLENHIKNELVENCELVHALPSCEERKSSSSEPRRSASIACGASVFEVHMKVPAWASEVLKQLAPDVSYRSLVMLGIASIQGLAVASFEKDDAKRLLFFYRSQVREVCSTNSIPFQAPSWFVPPAPSRERTQPCPTNPIPYTHLDGKNGCLTRRKRSFPSMRPIPHAHRHKLLHFSQFIEAERYNGDQVKAGLSNNHAKRVSIGSAPVTHRKSISSSLHAQQIMSLNPLPLKKHGCGRAPIHSCSEEDFLSDVMQFLILRGHTRLVPQGGLSEFPDAVLNATRLDLFNLYREVVSRGGFHVGNGINWKGQVFSKMHNHTLTNRMTGVGNTLKRHYETYLLEYELAHDDVDGECCLLCQSSAAGDWVNCGICGEWAHFGCDRRQGLGAFKDYAKTDGLEYICPHCSIANFKKKTQKTGNGY